MSTLTNSELDQIWAEADSKEDHKTLRLIAEIDLLKRACGTLDRRYKFSRKVSSAHAISSRRKAFCQGQSFMRGKVSHFLAEKGYLEASEVAHKVHVEYNCEIEGKYVHKPDHSSVG